MVHRLNGRCSVIVRGHANMAARTKKHADEDQITAVADWISDCEQTYECAVRVVLTSTVPKGRVTVRVEACDVVGERVVGVRARRRTTYPNASAVSLCGCLLNELIKLHSDLDAYKQFSEGVSSNPAV